MENIKVKLWDLPYSIHGLTIYYFDDDGQGYYTILLNSRDNAERNYQAYEHELSHINNCDFDKMLPIESLEAERHNEFRNII